MMSGGNYAVDGGFWSIAVAVQMSDAPFLTVIRSGSNVILSWPSAASTGFALEQNATLGNPSSWNLNGASVSDNGTTKSVTIPATAGVHFFRLRKP